mmetsp:Transcript_92930/g.164320  ORF Transcript_92930/g.164320 Transcript_92930/m.164320 type:complete len:80 (-) Transcript_92930:120-359(-)
MIAQQSEGFPEVVLRATPKGGEIIAMIPNGTPVKLLGREQEGHLELEVCLNDSRRGWVKKGNLQEATAPPQPKREFIDM